MMAVGGMPCQFCDGEHAATVLVTWLTNGASIQVCPEDFSPAMINVLAVDLGVDPAKFYEGVRKLVDRLAAAQAKEDAAAAAAEGDAAAAAGRAELGGEEAAAAAAAQLAAHEGHEAGTPAAVE